MVLWSRHREETDSYNQGIGWDIPLKLFLIFEGKGSICLPHVLIGTLPQKKKRKSIARRCRTIFIHKISRHYRLDFLVKQPSFQDNCCWINIFSDFDHSEGLIKGLPLQWTQDAIHSGKSCHSNIQNPITREFWSFPFRIPVAFGLCWDKFM